MAAPAATRLVANRYAIKTALGRNGMGMVWHAQDTLLGREVRVTEVVFPTLLAEAERRAAQAWVMREAGAIARVNHPGVVTLFDVVKDHGEIFIVTELVQAPTLADLVLAEGPLPPLRVAEIGADVASVLEAAHRAGVVHRDIKPANVMVQRDGGVRLAGFGVTALQGALLFAATGLAIGSPSYVAPEQARGEPSGPATDLWALGATMFFAVEGEPPFDKGTLTRTLAAVINEDPRPMLRAGPLMTLLTALLRKNPAERLSAPKVRVWLRWLVEVAQPTRPSEVLPVQERGETIPSEPPTSEPVSAPGGEVSAETAPEQPRMPVLRPTPPVRRPARARLAGVLTLLVVGGLLVAALAGTFGADPAGKEQTAPAPVKTGAATTGTTKPAPLTTKEPATAPTPTAPTTAAPRGGLPAGWRTFAHGAGNSRVGVPPGFGVRTRQRYNAIVVEEQGGPRRVFTVRSQNPSAPLPRASRDYRAWARRNFGGFRELRYDENQTYAGRGGAVVFEYQAVRDGRRVHVSHINVKGRTWGYNVELIVPADQWDASQGLAREFEQAFQPLG